MSRITRSSTREELEEILEIQKKNLFLIENKVRFSLCPSKEDKFNFQNELLQIHLDYSEAHELIIERARSLEERERMVAEHSTFSTRVNKLNHLISCMLPFDATIQSVNGATASSTMPVQAENNNEPVASNYLYPHSTPVRAPREMSRTMDYVPPIPPRTTINPSSLPPPIRSSIPPPIPPRPRMNQTQTLTTTTVENSASSSFMKIPKISPMRFSGEFSDWLEFKETFRICIGENNGIDEVGKMIHLKRLLDGEPHKLVAKLPATKANYSKAWDALEQRYGDTEKIKENLLNNVYNVKQCTSDDVEEVKKLIDDVALDIGQLQGLDVDVDKELMLVPIVRDKLPYSWRMEWARHVDRNPQNKKVTSFLQFLYDELKIREKSSSSTPVTKSSSYHHGSASALVGKFDTKIVKCTFCRENHYPSECQKSMNPEERKRLVQENKCCFRCGVKGHRAATCNFRKLCNCKTGQPPHIKQLCVPTKHNTNKGHGKVANGNRILMRSLGLRAIGTTKKIPTVRALCDTGCSYTTISKNLCQKIRPKKKGKINLNIETFGGNIQEGVFDVVEVTVEGLSQVGDLTFEAIVGPNSLGGSLEAVPLECIKEARSIGCIPLADIDGDEKQEIEILFGEDVYDKIISGPTITMNSGRKATPTIFGWMLHGKSNSEPLFVQNMNMLAFRCQVKLGEQIEQFWGMEHLGILPSEMNDYPVVEKVQNELIRVDGRYFVTWPWKQNKKQELASNEEVSLARLKSLLRRQTSDEFIRYNKEIQRLETEGHIEKCSPAPVDTLVSYLPHRGVIKEGSETTKLRIVFDASCRSKGKLALNQCLESGDNIYPSMFGILLRFRMKRVALCGDLAQAFLMMYLQEQERDVCRFFWVNDEGETIEYRFTKVFFGCTSSPFLLQVVLQDLIGSFANNNEFKFTVDQIKSNVYVDDKVVSLEDEDQAIKVWNESKKIFEDGGFNLRKLKSNSIEVLNVLGGVLPSVNESVLGVPWNAIDDDFCPGKTFLNELYKPTKRGVVSLLGQLYDPFGFLTPLVVPLKIFVQELWQRKVSWDEELDQKDKVRVQKIIDSWSGADQITFPRWIYGTESTPKYLFVFTDASEKAYAAVVYILCQHGNQIITNLMCSKSRLAPMKGWSIPKLELVAALIGSRLGFTVAEHIGIKPSSVFYFSDSKVALHWINSDHRRWGVFISNRVKEIQERGGRWFWTSGCTNPADIPSRGCGVNGLSDLWFHGPTWIKESGVNEEKFPTCSIEDDEITQVNLFLAVTESKNNVSYQEDFVEPKRTSKWNRTLRSVVYVLRFIKKSSNKGDIEISELNLAKTTIFVQVQKAFFSNEVENLKNGNSVRKDSKLKTMNPFLDANGLIRIGGRLQFANLAFDEKHPVVLTKCAVVSQLILSYHERFNHCGTGPLITALRKDGIWVIKAKKTVGAIIRTCRACRRFIAGPGVERTPPFPTTRTSYVRAFSITGVDLGGPLILRDGSKVWFSLFTCMTMRAVHLELLSSLSEHAIDLAFQRFTSRRGIPQIMLSDHGTNFVALSKSLKSQGLPLKWNFVVERGSWWGGCWERLIGVVKGLLKRTIGKSYLTYEELQTTLINIEKVVNIRPISFMYESCAKDGLPIPLYPELFLLPPATTEINQGLDEVWLDRQKYGKELMIMWQEEYLLQILGNAGNVWEDDKNRPIKEGDVVLVQGDTKNRLNWHMGVVENVFPGPDSIARVCEIRIKHDQKIKRPIQRLYSLELKSNEQKYCICNGKSYGDMIACDNDTGCAFGEWFHFDCVQIDKAPEGKWLCPFCR